MRSILPVFALLLWGLTVPASADAQSDAEDRQAAAEAYDRGTAAYLRGGYEEAAEWFETANRMSPAAPALMQAVRAHQHAGEQARAATLALRLSEKYPDEQGVSEYAGQVLDELAGQFVRIDVLCDGCRLDLDGTLQEFHSFFLEAETTHTLEAHFETGRRSTEIYGTAGEIQTIEFEAPPPPPPAVDDGGGDIGDGGGVDPGGRPIDAERRPLEPLFTYIGAGITGALLIGSIVSTLDMNSGVSDYEDAAMEATNACDDELPECQELFEAARDKLDEGESKETRTTVLWIATGAVAAGTATIAIFLTDWSPDDEDVAFGVTPVLDGAFAHIEGRF